MPTSSSRQWKTSMTIREHTSLSVGYTFFLKITIIHEQKIGKPAVWNFVLDCGIIWWRREKTLSAAKFSAKPNSTWQPQPYCIKILILIHWSPLDAYFYMKYGVKSLQLWLNYAPKKKIQYGSCRHVEFVSIASLNVPSLEHSSPSKYHILCISQSAIASCRNTAFTDFVPPCVMF